MSGDAEVPFPVAAGGPLSPGAAAFVPASAGGNPVDTEELTQKQTKRAKERQRTRAKKAAQQESAPPVRKSWFDLNSSRDEDDDESSSGSSYDAGGHGGGPSSSALSPQEVLCAELAAAYGYRPAQVDAAVERMFELGLPYDDAEEVDAFLRLEAAKAVSSAGAGVGVGATRGGRHETAGAAKSAAAAAPDEDEGTGDKESQTLPSTQPDSTGPPSDPTETGGEGGGPEGQQPVLAAAAASSSVDDDDDDDYDVGDDAATDAVILDEATARAIAADPDEVAHHAHAHHPAHPHHPAHAPLLDSRKGSGVSASNAAGDGSVVGVLTRLEMVSKASSLDDAIFALTEWVDKVATPTEIVDLCDTTKCHAFLTILKRTIQAPKPSSDKKVLVLIAEVLRGLTGDPDRPTESVTTAIGNSIKNARAVLRSSKTYGSAIDACGDAVAERVTADLHRAVVKLRNDTLVHKAANPTTKVETIRALEADIEALASSLAMTDGGLLGLMTKRDCHRTAAGMSSTAVGLAISSSTPPEEGGDSNGSSASDNSEDESSSAASMANPKNVMESLLGKDYDAIISAKDEYEQLRSELDAVRSSTASNRTNLMKERDGYRAERYAVNNRMEELRKELQELEKKGSELDASANAVESRLDGLDAELDDEVKTIKVGLAVRSAAYKVEEAARGVATELQSLRNALDDTTAPATPKGKIRDRPPLTPYSPEKVSTKMGVYFVRIRNYFKAEADCIEFISNRANNLEKGLAVLEREIDECAMLGMTTNVMLMTNSLRETQQNVTEDRGVVVMLASEAEKVQQDFMKRLGEYKFATSSPEMTPSQALSSLQVSVLSDIRDAMKRIGLKDNGLSAYIAGVASTPSTAASTRSTTKDDDTIKARPLNDTKDETDCDNAAPTPSEEDILKAADEFFAESDKDTVTVIDICISIEKKFGVNLDKPTRQAIKDRVLKLIDEEENGAPAKDQAVENCDAMSTLTPISHSTVHTQSSFRQPPPPPPPPPVSASKMPRLSWAKNPAAAAGRPPKGMSLLEIQQEEMSAKKALAK